ncbi:MAG: hypothetical protein Q8O76_15775 [Chloroflexota bacterium]|nr:hypothetical protein [Chloroflexota bacterium]
MEVSLGELGGQPAFIVDRIVGVGTGPLYTPADIAGNSSTEDALVMLDEMGIDTGVDIDKVLQLGRLLEWVLERQLRPYTTRQGRTLKAPVKWSVKPSLEFIPPYKDGNWAYPRY